MKIDSIEVEKALHNDRQLIDLEHGLSSSLQAALEVLPLSVSVLINRTILTSKNSSKPPSSDPNRLKTSRKKSD